VAADQVRIGGLLEAGPKVQAEGGRRRLLPLLLAVLLACLGGSLPEGGRRRQASMPSRLLRLLGPKDRWLTRELRLLLPLLRGGCCCC